MTPWLPCRFPAEAGHDRDGAIGAAGQSFTPTPPRPHRGGGGRFTACAFCSRPPFVWRVRVGACRFPAEAGRDLDRGSRAAGQRLTPTPAPIEWTYLDWSQLSVRKLRKIVGFDSKTNPANPLTIPFGIET